MRKILLFLMMCLCLAGCKTSQDTSEKQTLYMFDTDTIYVDNAYVVRDVVRDTVWNTSYVTLNWAGDTLVKTIENTIRERSVADKCSVIRHDSIRSKIVYRIKTYTKTITVKEKQTLWEYIDTYISNILWTIVVLAVAWLLIRYWSNILSGLSLFRRWLGLI